MSTPSSAADRAAREQVDADRAAGRTTPDEVLRLAAGDRTIEPLLDGRGNPLTVETPDAGQRLLTIPEALAGDDWVRTMPHDTTMLDTAPDDPADIQHRLNDLRAALSRERPAVTETDNRPAQHPDFDPYRETYREWVDRHPRREDLDRTSADEREECADDDLRESGDVEDHAREMEAAREQRAAQGPGAARQHAADRRQLDRARDLERDRQLAADERAAEAGRTRYEPSDAEIAHGEEMAHDVEVARDDDPEPE